MGLSCEEELDGMLRIIDYGVKPVEVGEEEGASLVGRKTTGKAYRQDIIPQVLLDGHDLAGGIVIAECRIGNNLLDHLYQPGFQDLPGAPNLIVRNLIDSVKAGFVIVMGLEFGTEHP